MDTKPKICACRIPLNIHRESHICEPCMTKMINSFNSIDPEVIAALEKTLKDYTPLFILMVHQIQD